MQLYQHLRLSSTGRLATWANALALGACLLLAALACGLRSPLHDLPLERDEGAYAIIATRWLAGDALYRDLFDHKPPLVYLVFALARILPGDAVRAIRELATLYLLLVSFAVLALGWRLYGRWPGVAAQALVLAYGTSRAFEGLTFNSESVLILPATLGCLLVVVGMQGRRPALFGWAGMCVGLAVASKPVGAVLLAPQVLAPLMVPWPWRRRLAGASLGLAGAALPLLGFGLLLWRQ
ncbi:MAG TPA: glycosyltransferase family 39 protein, partial [Roseiflexaceae bacterium]